ncbi:hypothetical protein [Halorubellus sp. PRR65]|uniref:hypothetical protein n=1 Tax=Halorubellus sp. PRR65 TaxID=3098148 RepID=UPI002B26153E|nr:hypothetical protein [Halorubellus sp. PRR65]
MIANTPVPVIILDGPAGGSTREMFALVEEAMDADARGLLIGRRIWKSDDSARTVSVLTGIVHDGRSVAVV